MTYKEILVHVDRSEGCGARIGVAIGLAKKFDAHLTGLCPTAFPVLPAYIAGSLPADLLANQEAETKARAQAALTNFEAECERHGVAVERRLEHCVDTEVAMVISRHARYADLVVLGQSDPEDPLSTPQGVLEDVALASARPTLIVPYIGAEKEPGGRVMLAWDAGREAARAATDALPLLRAAQSVTVMIANPRSSFDGHGENPGADVAHFLARHGVKAEVHNTEAKDISIGDAILSRLADENCDLLVMGAYGHARLRELVLGGVTRTILGHMTVPVLLSH